MVHMLDEQKILSYWKGQFPTATDAELAEHFRVNYGPINGISSATSVDSLSIMCYPLYKYVRS